MAAPEYPTVGLVPLTRATEDWADAELEAEFARLNHEIQRRTALRALEIDALKREVDAQMQVKLNAQSLLANITKALAFESTDFDLNDTWGSVAPRIIKRLTEIVERAETLEHERDAIGAALGEPCAECGHIEWRSDGYAQGIEDRAWVGSQIALCDEFLRAAERDDTFGVEDIEAKRAALTGVHQT